MKGFKIFNNDWTCSDFQFEVGKVFEEDATPVCCERGFHFCTKLIDCFKYYAFNPENKVAEVEALGNIDTNEDDSKCCTNKIHIIRELSWHEVLELLNDGLGNTGKGNAGDENTGDHNSGDWNSGDYNTGNLNSGHKNSGYRNSGNNNTGNYNTGSWNSGNYNTGCFNTKSPKINMFDKPSNWTLSDWNNSDARFILRQMPSTERQTWWDNLIENSKEIVMNLPNFDKNIFKEITGIEIKDKN